MTPAVPDAVQPQGTATVHSKIHDPLARPLSLRVNGAPRQLWLDPRTGLLDALREHLQLSGTKKGCDQGACGACTVLANGQRVLSCLSLALQHEGDEVTTIEGLVNDEAGHLLHDAFIEADGFQCGYCTPGRRIMNPSLSEYHVPVNLDVPYIEILMNDLADEHTPLGARGLGEIGITGAAAAIANAVYHATGKRIRSLPITLDKLL
jgi:aerobic-type carbon monoxide dehydrogenase small subunit (CoxS/CutS family)